MYILHILITLYDIVHILPPHGFECVVYIWGCNPEAIQHTSGEGFIGEVVIRSCRASKLLNDPFIDCLGWIHNLEVSFRQLRCRSEEESMIVTEWTRE
jgi:hypothetical protein